MILEFTETDKILHRKPVNLKFIIHNNVIDKIRNSGDKVYIALLEELIKYQWIDQRTFLLKDKKEFDFVKYSVIRQFWQDQLKAIPEHKKVLLDGKLKVGEYQLTPPFERLIFVVRSAKRFGGRIREQVIELNFNQC